MTQRFEHDWPPTMKYHRKARRIETVEILPPRQPEPAQRTIRVDIDIRHHRSRSYSAQLFIIAAAIVLALIAIRLPGGGLLMLMAFVPTWLAAVIVVAMLIAAHERIRRRRF